MIGKRDEPHLSQDYDYVDANFDDQLKRLGQYSLKSCDAPEDEGGFIACSTLRSILIAMLHSGSGLHPVRIISTGQYAKL